MSTPDTFKVGDRVRFDTLTGPYLDLPGTVAKLDPDHPFEIGIHGDGDVDHRIRWRHVSCVRREQSREPSNAK